MTEEHSPKTVRDQDVKQKASASPDVSRRGFLKGLGGAGALAVAGGAGLGTNLLSADPAEAEVIGPLRPNHHVRAAVRVRSEAARSYLRDLPGLPEQSCNGDEDLYADKRASFHKTLPQNQFGEVDLGAYSLLVGALDSGVPSDFEAIPLAAGAARKLANPQAAYAFDVTGLDSHGTRMRPAPAFASAEIAAEMGEVYWQALTRDVPFSRYDVDPWVGAAVADLNGFSETVGPKVGGQVTAGTLFRGETPGDLVGPYISQFLWLPVNYGPLFFEQRYRSGAAGVDFMTDQANWLNVQRGGAPQETVTFGDPLYLWNNRALGEYVHGDVTFQAYLNAALILQGFGPGAIAPENPYNSSLTQGGFVTFGPAERADMVTRAANIALKGAWFQKWLVHRRLRPEVYAGRVHFEVQGQRNYGLNAEILNSAAVSSVVASQGTAFLPMAFVEGSPTHPAYPAGHATNAGACATILKALFNEDFVIPNPVVANDDGTALLPYFGPDLTVGGEINKLANNIALGRDAAGVHYRSDGVDGISVGEQQAIGMLRDWSRLYNEDFDGFVLTTFGGERIRIADGDVFPA